MRPHLKAINSFWGGFKGNILIITPSFPVDEKILESANFAHKDDLLTGRPWITLPGDYRALELILRVLRMMYKYNKIKVISADDVNAKNLELCNIILLGGPVNNCVTRSMVKKGILDDLFQGYELVFNQKQKFQSEYEKDRTQNSYKNDFGVICRKKLKNGKFLVYLAGCRSYGNQGAAAIATLGDSLESIKKNNINFDNLSVVCSIKPKVPEIPLSKIKSSDETLVRIEAPFVSAEWTNRRDIDFSFDQAYTYASRIKLDRIMSVGGIFGGFCFATVGLLTGVWTCALLGVILAIGSLIHLNYVSHL